MSLPYSRFLSLGQQWPLGGRKSDSVFVCRKKVLSPAAFKYTVRMTKDGGSSEPFTVKANQIR